MTRKKWAKLSKEEKRAKVAILCGYKFHPENRRMKWSRDESRISGGVFSVAPPDYLNDLNAMYEAEKLIPWVKWGRYIENLMKVTKPGKTASFEVTYFALLHATAAQRAEAFVMAMEEEEGR